MNSNVSEFKYSSLLTNNALDTVQSNTTFSINNIEKNKAIVEHFSNQNASNTTNRNGFVINNFVTY